MPKGKAGSVQNNLRIISILLTVAALVVCVFYSFSQAYANFSSESTQQIIGVGRIQSSSVAVSPDANTAAHFEAPKQLSDESVEAVSQLAQPLARGVEDTEEAIAAINLIQRFGEPDEGGWFTTLASAYGPSSAGQYTAIGTELTLTSMDIGIQVNHMDLVGQYVDLMYNGIVLRCRIVDTGGLAPGRLFDLQPGVCTAFGAETPEFGWGVRTVKWRFAS